MFDTIEEGGWVALSILVGFETALEQGYQFRQGYQVEKLTEDTVKLVGFSEPAPLHWWRACAEPDPNDCWW